MKARLIAVFGIVVAVIGAGALFLPSTAQDLTENRVSELETRVAALETQVANDPEEVIKPFSTPIPEEFTIAGTLRLVGTENEDYSVLATIGCFGLGGYDDIGPGTQVRVTDAAGTLLGIGELVPDTTSTGLKQCRFTFEVEVPMSEFYTVSAGHSRRDGITYSFDDLVESDWTVSLSLG